MRPQRISWKTISFAVVLSVAAWSAVEAGAPGGLIVPTLDPPAEWGAIVTVVPTVVNDLLFVRSMPVLDGSPGSEEFVARLDAAIARGDDAAFVNDPFVQGKVVSIASLWKIEPHGYRLLAAMADTRTGTGWSQSPFPPGRSELTEPAVATWRTRLLDLVATLSRVDLLEPAFMREVRHFGEVTGDLSVDRAWSEKLDPASCIDDNDNRKACNQCCEGKTEQWRDWCFLTADAAGEIVGGLGGIFGGDRGERAGKVVMGYARAKCIEGALQRLQVCHFGCGVAFHFCIGISNPKPSR